MAKRKITRFDFRAEYVDNVPPYRYKFAYTSPTTSREWVLYSCDETIFEDLRDRRTTQKQLNEIKILIKIYGTIQAIFCQH